MSSQPFWHDPDVLATVSRIERARIGLAHPSPTLYGHRVAWCRDPEVHGEHSRFNHRTQESTICPGTTVEEAEAHQHERAWSQTQDNDK